MLWSEDVLSRDGTRDARQNARTLLKFNKIERKTYTEKLPHVPTEFEDEKNFCFNVSCSEIAYDFISLNSETSHSAFFLHSHVQLFKENYIQL